jgi:hypothetical protein
MEPLVDRFQARNSRAVGNCSKYLPFDDHGYMVRETCLVEDRLAPVRDRGSPQADSPHAGRSAAGHLPQLFGVPTPCAASFEFRDQIRYCPSPTFSNQSTALPLRRS